MPRRLPQSTACDFNAISLCSTLARLTYLLPLYEKVPEFYITYTEGFAGKWHYDYILTYLRSIYVLTILCLCPLHPSMEEFVSDSTATGSNSPDFPVQTTLVIRIPDRSINYYHTFYSPKVREYNKIISRYIHKLGISMQT